MMACGERKRGETPASCGAGIGDWLVCHDSA